MNKLSKVINVTDGNKLLKLFRYRIFVVYSIGDCLLFEREGDKRIILLTDGNKIIIKDVTYYKYKDICNDILHSLCINIDDIKNNQMCSFSGMDINSEGFVEKIQYLWREYFDE